jgi:hypothetical protein
MPADSVNSVIRRISGYVDTSGAEPPRGIQMVPMMGGGVYTQIDDAAGGIDVLQGRISLGILGAMVVGAVLFYIWTSQIQGGG